MKIDIGIVESIAVADLSIDFTDVNPSLLKLSSTKLTAGLIKIPEVFGSAIQWPVTQCHEQVTIEDKNVDIAMFKTPKNAATVAGSVLTTVVLESDLIIPTNMDDAFADFMTSLITKAEHTFILKGTVGASLAVSMPKFPAFGQPKSFDVTNVGFRSSITLKGLGTSTFSFKSHDAITRSAEGGAYTFVATVDFENLSQLILTTGKLSFKLIDNAGVEIGIATVENLKLVLGSNPLTVAITLTSESAYQTLITTGDTYTISGYDGMSTDTILNKGMSAYRSQIAIPKLTPAV
ncbi:hypothetical protein BGZ51_005392 [Haplosporangium sp. Z 767]|nr:hypothetical protein BGZ51_005392 [Haplosporangium sp. Z 767]KAF9181795.1 hypothetical protein BGZ50_005321 [Haplosporangium sp. Z 11]